MPSPGKVVLAYFATVSAIFMVGYFVLNIREMSLYLFLLALNLPSSLVAISQIEALATAVGLPLGHPTHVFATQLICMAINGMLLFTVARFASSLWRRGRRAV